MKRKSKYLVKILCNITIWQPSFCQDNGGAAFFFVWQGPSLPYICVPYTRGGFPLHVLDIVPYYDLSGVAIVRAQNV